MGECTLNTNFLFQFFQQFRHYESNIQIFKLDPSNENKTLGELAMFISQVAHCYTVELEQFPQELIDVLQQHFSVMDSDLRMTFCRALILLRNKNLLSPTSLLELFFRLFRCKDKLLRETLFSHIVTDIKNINAKHKNNKVNTLLQNFMYTMLRDNNAIAAKKSLDVMIELYRRNIWKDAKTVNVITTACFSPVTKILVAAFTFFLGKDEVNKEEGEVDDDSDQEVQVLVKNIIFLHLPGRGRFRGKFYLSCLFVDLQKRKKRRNMDTTAVNFSALHLVNDPQGFSEKLFKQLETCKERFEVKIMMMDLISRLIAVHQLFLFNFYPYIQRYLQPHQREVTKLLTCFAQACHELVPPDVVESGLKTIVNNFVTERNSNEVMAVGLNAVREVSARCPLAMTEDLLQDLVLYKKSKDKSVIMASRSLIQLFRAVNPTLLHRNDRGRPTEDSKDFTVKQYGELKATDYVPGTEVNNFSIDTLKGNFNLIKPGIIYCYLRSSRTGDWESDSDNDDDDDDDAWVDVPHSSDEAEENGDQGKKEVDDNNEDEKKDKKSKAARISQTRLLTDEDFQKMRNMEAARALNIKSSKKRKMEVDVDEPPERGELISVGDIENIHKKRKHDKESRLETVLAGREGREKFSSKKARNKRFSEFASTTNKEKKKNKNFMMMRQNRNVRGKPKRSFREKQIALKNALLKSRKAKY
ncbi:PREDICTED: protein SDA1 homolog [Acropora digitifera]|uniref:protein SDA1 homolog n=1 Tax=Acropora digitifera TaxID=70779 RepID=UPI00077A094B|nr:PREDICTED: protein SDA1 homolog [Acropora digitifera]